MYQVFLKERPAMAGPDMAVGVFARGLELMRRPRACVAMEVLAMSPDATLHLCLCRLCPKSLLGC